MQLDNIDQKLLNLLQKEFPLVANPFACIGQDFGIAENEVIRRLGRLKNEGTIRQIGPLFDARRLNYRTTLVAMRATGVELDKALQIISEHPVSHAYERDHHFNLWFTLALPADVDIDKELKKMMNPVKSEACFSLPATRLFKLRVFFNTGGDEQGDSPETPQHGTSQAADLSQLDKKVINESQGDLPLVSHPFRDIAARAGLDEEKFLEQCCSLLKKGILRRFSASVNHRKVGFDANAMVCWVTPPEKVDAAGQRLASLREVSHCYERRTNPLWRHNLFAMVHGQEREQCLGIAEKISAEFELKDYALLYSTREFKKMRLKYTV